MSVRPFDLCVCPLTPCLIYGQGEKYKRNISWINVVKNSEHLYPHINRERAKIVDEFVKKERKKVSQTFVTLKNQTYFFIKFSLVKASTSCALTMIWTIF